MIVFLKVQRTGPLKPIFPKKIANLKGVVILIGIIKFKKKYIKSPAGKIY